MWTKEEITRAQAEDRLPQKLLKGVRNRPDRPMSKPESVAAGKVAVVEGLARAAETVARRIECKELLSAAEI